MNTQINVYYSKNRKRQQKYERRYTRCEYIEMIIDGIKKCNFPSIIEYLLTQTLLSYNYPINLYVQEYTYWGYKIVLSDRKENNIDEINIDLNKFKKYEKLFYTLSSHWAHSENSLDTIDTVAVRDYEAFLNHDFEKNGAYEEGRKYREEVHLLKPRQYEEILYAKFYKMEKWFSEIPTIVFTYSLYLSTLSLYLNDDIIKYISDIMI